MTTATTPRAITAAPSGPAAAYRRVARRRGLLLAGLSAALAVSVAMDVASGPAPLSLPDVVAAVVAPEGVDSPTEVIVRDVRLPVALMAVLVGAALGVAGAEMQTILDNPLASPFTLGISAAASFGAALALVVGVGIIPAGGDALVTGNAFLFAMLASLLVHAVSRARGVSAESIVLVGIALVFLFTSLLSFLEYVASEQALQQIVFWTMGSLARATWGKVAATAAVLAVVVPWFVRQAGNLTLLRLGEDKASSLGVDTRRLRLRALLAVSVLASAAVASVGTVGFVGLVGPHLARLLVGEDQRRFLPASALAGALLLSLTSIVSKTLVPGVLLPVGIITSLVGIPFFLSLVLTRRRPLW